MTDKEGQELAHPLFCSPTLEDLLEQILEHHARNAYDAMETTQAHGDNPLQVNPTAAFSDPLWLIHRMDNVQGSRKAVMEQITNAWPTVMTTLHQAADPSFHPANDPVDVVFDMAANIAAAQPDATRANLEHLAAEYLREE